MNREEHYQTLAADALAFISDKYGKEFTPVFYENNDYLSTVRRIHCYTDGMDRENEHAEIVITRDGENYEFSDNYFSYYIRPAAEQYIAELITREFSDCKVYREKDTGTFPDTLTCESTLEDLYRVKSDYWMSVKAYIPAVPGMAQEEYAAKAQRIEQALLESGHRYTIYIFAVSDEVYQSIDRYQQDDFWRFFAANRTPDGEKYFYVYKSTILDGEVK